jgi:enoyl-CoA hydratase/carnithine racemase
MFNSREDLEHQVRVLAAKLARQLSVGGINICKEQMYQALRSELTVGDIIALRS